jgi:hypothetical protein
MRYNEKMIISIVGNLEDHKVVTELENMGHSVIGPILIVEADNERDRSIRKINAIKKTEMCKLLVLQDNDPYGINDAIIQRAILNNQIIILDNLRDAEGTINHIKKETTNA